ncbi:hypothetical protein ACH4U6_04310 [Streptomyces netropsis]|uniref:hypothetical protein n=1 Tax=Streptomyces netropsis TaxID=55404 RepID=UPI00379F4755
MARDEHSRMYYFDKAVGKAVEVLYFYAMDGSRSAAEVRDTLRLSHKAGTDWIHASYRDLVTIPFAELARKGDIGEIERRVGGQFKQYYDAENPNASIRGFRSYLRAFVEARKNLLGEVPEEKYKDDWKASCTATDEVNTQFEKLNGTLDELAAAVKEALDVARDCKGDRDCLEGAITEWKRALECARVVDGPEE